MRERETEKNRERHTERERERERVSVREILAGTSGSKENHQIIMKLEAAMGYVVELDNTGLSRTNLENCYSGVNLRSVSILVIY